MAIPLATYYTRIDAMVQEALSDYRSSPDRTALNQGAKNYAIRLTGMAAIDSMKITHVAYQLQWEILLIHGASDLGNKGVMRAWMYDDIATLQDYFDNHHNLILDTQTNDNMISGFRPATLSLVFNSEGDIGKTRATQYTLSFTHDVFNANRQV